jgi:hypothetical protein
MFMQIIFTKFPDDAVSDANDVSTDIGELWEKFPVNELFIDPSGET